MIDKCFKCVECLSVQIGRDNKKVKMNGKDIIRAWVKIRKLDKTIPDEVLDFMKDAAIDKLTRHLHGDTSGVCYNCLNGFHEGCSYGPDQCSCNKNNHKEWWWKTKEQVAAIALVDELRKECRYVNEDGRHGFAIWNECCDKLQKLLNQSK